MNKKEFLRNMNKAKNDLKEVSYWNEQLYINGVCDAISNNFPDYSINGRNYWLDDLFGDLYRKESPYKNKLFWLGNRKITNKKSLARREFYLDHFKNFLLETKLYKEL
jgi:hypothetical protein